MWRRPFEMSAVWELLTHLAAMTPRGAVIWEIRGREGHARYHLGADGKRMDKIEEVMKTHGDIRFYDTQECTRTPVGIARRLQITRPARSGRFLVGDRFR